MLIFDRFGNRWRVGSGKAKELETDLRYGRLGETNHHSKPVAFEVLAGRVAGVGTEPAAEEGLGLEAELGGDLLDGKGGVAEEVEAVIEFAAVEVLPGSGAELAGEEAIELPRAEPNGGGEGGFIEVGVEREVVEKAESQMETGVDGSEARGSDAGVEESLDVNAEPGGKGFVEEEMGLDITPAPKHGAAGIREAALDKAQERTGLPLQVRGAGGIADEGDIPGEDGKTARPVEIEMEGKDACVVGELLQAGTLAGKDPLAGASADRAMLGLDAERAGQEEEGRAAGEMLAGGAVGGIDEALVNPNEF